MKVTMTLTMHQSQSVGTTTGAVLGRQNTSSEQLATKMAANDLR